MFFYTVLTPISTTSGLGRTGNSRKYHQIDVYIYQCDCVWGFCVLSLFLCVVLERLKIILLSKCEMVAFLLLCGSLCMCSNFRIYHECEGGIE